MNKLTSPESREIDAYQVENSECDAHIQTTIEVVIDRTIHVIQTSTALHLAVKRRSADLVKDLLERGLDPNIQQEQGISPLILAARMGLSKIAAVLLEAGADPNLCDSENKSPLHVAITTKRKSIVNLLLTHGADPNIQDGNGRTPLHLVAFALDDAFDDLESIKSIRTINPSTGRTQFIDPKLIRDSTTREHDEIINLFMAHGADPNIIDNHGVSPFGLIFGRRLFEYIVQERWEEACAFLREHLQAGITAYQKKEQNWTPLHLAVWKGSKELVKELIGCGASLESRDAGGLTPKDWSTILCLDEITMLFNLSENQE